MKFYKELPESERLFNGHNIQTIVLALEEAQKYIGKDGEPPIEFIDYPDLILSQIAVTQPIDNIDLKELIDSLPKDIKILPQIKNES